MTQQEYQHLQAERTFLEQQLADLPAVARITRLSTEARLRAVEARLAAIPPQIREPARARLTFRGRPVVASHGVFAAFGTRATSTFVDAVTKLAVGTSRPLAAMGPVPTREESEFLITSTAVGSFGFELEEHLPQPSLYVEERSAAQALAQMCHLLQSTLGTDDELTEAIAGTDRRAVDAVRAFLEVLQSSQAVCTLECGTEVFRFSDVGQVRRSTTRLAQENLHEEILPLEGRFLGFLPHRRSFEFRPTATEAVITGKVSPAVEEAEAINHHLGQATRIQLMARHVGNGKPRYILIATPEWLKE
jgi:hypothetical protein